jgi:hypothetical protein
MAIIPNAAKITPMDFHIIFRISRPTPALEEAGFENARRMRLDSDLPSIDNSSQTMVLVPPENRLAIYSSARGSKPPSDADGIPETLDEYPIS